MKILRLQKIKYSQNVFVERALPSEGLINLNVGDSVEPVTKLGMAKVSYGRAVIGKDLKLARGKLEDGFFYTGETIGRTSKKKVISPFDGSLKKLPDGTFVLQQEERDHWLLAGAWGEVANVLKDRSALVKTQTLDIGLMVSTNNSVSGELIVFPNPSELLEMQYLEQFSKDVYGKLIYVGNYVGQELLTKASQMGVSGIVAGSGDRTLLSMAYRYNMFLGFINGFGHMPTPPHVFDVLKEVSNRYVFFEGGKRLLRIPVPSHKAYEQLSNDACINELEPGMLVQILEKPYFGWFGKIESIQDGVVYVNLDDADEVFDAHAPNVIAVG